MTRFKTVEEVWENMADCDRRERQMELYGPYDPRADDVMEGWRSAEHAPRAATAEELRNEAKGHRAIAGVHIDMSKAPSVSNPLGYTPEEIESSIRFKETSRALARYCDMAAQHADEGPGADDIDAILERHPEWSDAVKAEWRACAAGNDSRGLMRNRHLVKIGRFV